jgi:methionine--tRNA ligase beta chain
MPHGSTLRLFFFPDFARMYHMLTFDEFKNVDLRLGLIKEAVRVEGSEKLLKLMVDLGEKDAADLPVLRQIVSGIAKSYTPEDLVGRQVVIVANLEPRKLMGLESNGMLLAAHDEEGNPVIISPIKEGKTGSKIT